MGRHPAHHDLHARPTWSSLYIAGRKGRELVTVGPYSTCRNPLYFFSIVGAAGMGAQSGSLTLGLICGMIAASFSSSSSRRKNDC